MLMKTQNLRLMMLVLASLVLAAPPPAPGAAIPHLVRDLYSGPANAVYPADFAMASAGRVVIFRAYGTPVGGYSYFLWASDGTEAGTIALTPITFSPTMLAADLNGHVYFDKTKEVWVTDGTPAGTHFLVKINSDAVVKIPYTLAADNGLYFAVDVGGWGVLYYTDGVKAYQLQNYIGLAAYAPPCGKIELVACQGHALYFTISSTTGLELWKSDGTPAGTMRIYQFGLNVMSVPAYVASIGNMMYFTEMITSSHSALWKTDGTPAGTVLVSDNMNVPLYFPTTFQDRIYFLGYNNGNYSAILYKSDGTARGTTAITTANGYPIYASATPTILYFATTTCFMKTSGSSAQQIGNVIFASGMHRPIIQIPGEERWILSAFGPNNLGQELWESDGTGGGTHMIADICGGSSSSSPDDFTVCGDQLFFTAKDAVHGRELWVMPLHEAITAAREWDGYR